MVALLPIGMSQVRSVNFDPELKVGAEVKKGDMLDYFLFGGSDFVVLFQQGVRFELTAPPASNGTYLENMVKLPLKNGGMCPPEVMM